MSSVEHAISLWFQGNGVSGVGSVAQKAAWIGRLKCTADRTGNDGFDSSLLPYAFALDRVTDTWGVSIPPGVYGAAVNGWNTSLYTGSYSSRMQQSWEADLGQQLMILPSALPSGYTPVYARGWHNTPRANPFLGIGRTANGPVNLGLIPWLPSGSPLGSQTNFTFTSFPSTVHSLPPGGVDVSFWGSYPGGTGNRNIKLRLHGGTSSLAGSPPATFTINGTHNANGSYPGSAPGDTVDFSYTFNFPGDTPFNGTENTSVDIDLPVTAYATRGVATTFAIEIHYFQASASVFTSQLQMKFSPRLDIPLPYAVTGQGDIYCAGGLP